RSRKAASAPNRRPRPTSRSSKPISPSSSKRIRKKQPKKKRAKSSAAKKKPCSKKPKRGKADDVRDPGAAGATRALRRTADDRRAPRSRPHGLGADLRRGRLDRLQRLHPRPGDVARHPRQPEL